MYLVRNFGANGTIFDLGKRVLFKPSSVIYFKFIFYQCETKIGQIEKCAWQGYLKVVPPFHAPSFLTTLHLRVRLTLPSCPFLQLDFIIWTFWFTILSLVVVCYNNNFYVKKNCYWSRIYSPWRTKMKQNFCVGGHKIELPPMIKSVSAKFATKNKTTQLLLLFH